MNYENDNDWYSLENTRARTATLKSLREQRAALIASTEKLLDKCDDENRGLTDLEKIQFDTDVSQVENLNKSIGPLQANPPLRFNRQPVEAPSTKEIFKIGSNESFYGNGARSGAVTNLRAFQNSREGRSSAYRSGQWLRATLLGDMQAMNWCQSNGVNVNVMAAHSGSENSKGGALVPEELSNIIIRLIETHGVFRRNTRVLTMSSDTIKIPRRVGGLTAYFTGEGVAGTESDSSWDVVTLVAKKLMVLTRMSSEISDDSIIDMVDMLSMECGLSFALKEDEVGFNGDGSAAHGGIEGILTKAINGNHDLAKVVAAVPHNLLGEIDADDILKLMSAIPNYAKMGSKFYCSPSALELVFNAIKIAGGGNTFDVLANAPRPSFLGHDIETSPLFPDNPATDYDDLVMIGFGNLQMASTMGSRRDIRFMTSSDKYWEEDQIGIKCTERFDINVHDLGSSTIKSPFAVLIGDAA